MTKILTELEKHLEKVPPMYRGLATRALKGRCGKAGAVKAKCQECVGYEDVSRRVGQCTVWRCPLWRFRPFQKSKALIQDGLSTSTPAPGEGLEE